MTPSPSALASEFDALAEKALSGKDSLSTYAAFVGWIFNHRTEISAALRSTQEKKNAVLDRIAGMEEEIARAMIAPEVEAHVDQIQGFLYGVHHVIRDCSKPHGPGQEISRTIFEAEHNDRYELERAKVRARAVISAIQARTGE